MKAFWIAKPIHVNELQSSDNNINDNRLNLSYFCMVNQNDLAFQIKCKYMWLNVLNEQLAKIYAKHLRLKFKVPTFDIYMYQSYYVTSFKDNLENLIL